jgi:HTH-type transcriptional regulator / antitoxin HipB
MLIRTPTDLGALIRDRRRQMSLDQATLAKRIGVSRQWVIAIEQGRSRAELGLVLRALDAVGIRLNADSGGADQSRKHAKAPKVDIDAIVTSARKGRR